MPKLIEMTLAEFGDLLASDAPAPGGGSAAALAGAQAAALMAMVCRLTIGRKKYADVQAEVEDALARLERLRAELTELVDADTLAYQAFGDALALPKDTDAERAARAEAMRQAAKTATRVPARTLEAAFAVFAIVQALHDKTNRNALSDVGTALQLAYAAVVGASLNVAINLPGTGDEVFNAPYAERCAEIRRRADAAVGEVAARIRGLIG